MTAPTLSAPGVIDITATSARPQVTLTYGALAGLVSTLFGNNEAGGLWLPAQDTRFTDEAGTTPAGVDDTVARLNDSSGNASDATQATVAERPALGRTVEGGRRNQLQHTETFSTDFWVWARIRALGSGSALVEAPDGTTTALYMQQEEGQTTAGVVAAQIPFSLGSDTTYFQVYAKAGEKKWMYVLLRSTSPVCRFWVNLETATIGSVGGSVTPSAEMTGDGWVKVNAPYNNSNSHQTDRCNFYVADDDNLTTVTDSGGIYIWHPQAEVGVAATDYQRVGSELDVTESGKPELWYLKRDGIDDALIATFAASLGTACTISIADSSGVTTLTSQTIGTTYDLLQSPEVFGVVVTDDALTTNEQTEVDTYLGGLHP